MVEEYVVTKGTIFLVDFSRDWIILLDPLRFSQRRSVPADVQVTNLNFAKQANHLLIFFGLQAQDELDYGLTKTAGVRIKLIVDSMTFAIDDESKKTASTHIRGRARPQYLIVLLWLLL
jgi:hypothetical protein